MIGAIAKAIGSVGKAAGSAGKFGSETMEGLRPTMESAVKIAAPRLEIPQPLSGPPREFVSGLMVKGDRGSLGVRSALENLATFGGNNTAEEKMSDEERLRREIEEQRNAEKRRKFKDDLAEALTPPTYGPGEEPAHIVSKNLEELPQALGESTTNTPVTNPR